MASEAMDRYQSWPERLYIIDRGIVVFQGGIGPFDYRPSDVREWLVQRFGERKRKTEVLDG